MTTEIRTYAPTWRQSAGWALVVAWMVSVVLPFAVPSLALTLAAMPLVILLSFAWVHGSQRYGARAVTLFFVAVAIVANLLENSSIAIGFPFGFYAHQPAMGPKLFLVPLIIGPAYFAVCYLAWTTANALLGEADLDRQPGALVALAITAAFVATGYDAVADPAGATVRHDWIYRHPGGYYGVPLSNYGGWLLTTFMAFLLGGVMMRKFGAPARVGQPLGWWLQSAALLIFQPMPSLLSLLFVPSRIVKDASGTSWNTADIAEGTLIVGIVSCVAFGVIAGLVRWRHQTPG